MNRHIAKFEVSAQLIMQALAMPEGTKIYRITQHDRAPDTFVFYVENDDLPELVEAQKPPLISPILKADFEKQPSTWITFDWNIHN